MSWKIFHFEAEVWIEVFWAEQLILVHKWMSKYSHFLAHYLTRERKKNNSALTVVIFTSTSRVWPRKQNVSKKSLGTNKKKLHFARQTLWPMLCAYDVSDWRGTDSRVVEASAFLPTSAIRWLCCCCWLTKVLRLPRLSRCTSRRRY